MSDENKKPTSKADIIDDKNRRRIEERVGMLRESYRTTRTLIENRWYEETPVFLDGFHYKNCRFDRCMLINIHTDFEIESCFISPDTRIEYGERGIISIRLFMSQRPEFDHFWPGLGPERLNGGKVTIHGRPLPLKKSV